MTYSHLKVVSVPDLIRAVIASSIPPRKTVWGTAYLQLVTVEFNSCVAEALLTTCKPQDDCKVYPRVRT